MAYGVANPVDRKRYALKRVKITNEGILNEARIHSNLNHPSVVKYCYSWLESSSDPCCCLLLEKCQSEMWDAFENGTPALTPVIRERWTLQLTSALAHIHAARVIHRDLNPWNVFLSGEFDVKVRDFDQACVNWTFALSTSALIGW